jgi:hypothetical protein
MLLTDEYTIFWTDVSPDAAMTNQPQQKTLITRYLLGQVSERERAEVEDRYLSNDDLFEELVDAENDMIDAYVRGRLDATERSRFETYFLITEDRRERVQFAKSLMSLDAPVAVGGQAKLLGGRPATIAFWRAQSPAIRLTVTTVLLAAVAGVSWLVMMNRDLRHKIADARTSQASMQRQADDLRREVAALREEAAHRDQPLADLPAPGSASLSFALAPGLVRNGGRQNTLRLSADVSQVLLLLQRDRSEHGAYEVVLETAEGGQIWRKAGLESRPTRDSSTVVVVPLSPSLINRGDYVLRLFRRAAGPVEEVGTYSFRVIRQ